MELRYRQRYADLAVHPEVREHFRRRSRIVRGIREFFDARGYVEVETPVLQRWRAARRPDPFMTHHNALDYDFKLRISLELYLKRLIVGGFEKVYEIGRVFRNEGISTRHNPEFSLLESYEAYANLEDIDAPGGGARFRSGDRPLRERPRHRARPGDRPLPPWRRLPMLEGIRQFAGVPPEAFHSFESARAAGIELGLDMTHEVNVGGIIEKLHERFVQPKLIAPTFITDFPGERPPRPQRRGAGHQRRLAAVAGRAGAHLRQPDVPGGQLRRLHPRLRHQLRGALPRDGRGARGAHVHLGRIFCDREAARFRRITDAAATSSASNCPGRRRWCRPEPAQRRS